MKSSQSTETKNDHFTLSDLKILLFDNKRWLITLGMIVSGIIFMNWNLLVSIGAASIILAVGPCLIMCSLGLCMNSSSCKKKPANDSEH